MSDNKKSPAKKSEQETCCACCASPAFFNNKYFRLNIALGTLAGLIVAWFVGIFSLDFRAPMQPFGDYLMCLFHVKSLIAFGTVQTNPDVAFPPGGDFTAFPTPDALAHVIVETLGFFTDNPFLVLSIFTTLCFVGVTLSAFMALRMSGASILLSFAGAVVYGASSHMIERAPMHSWLCLLVVIPWICRICLLMPYQGARLGQKPLGLSLGGAIFTGIAAGMSGLYWAFFSAFFLATALLIMLLQRAPLKVMKPGIAALGALSLSFSALMAPTIWAVISEGIQLPQRDLFSQALYGIHLTDVFIPRIPLITSFYDNYANAQNSISSEGNYAVLGLWGLLGLLYGIYACLAKLFPDYSHATKIVLRRAPMLRMSTFLACFGLAFAAPYGLGFIFNMLVSNVIRSQNRIGVFIIFFSIIMAAALFERLRTRTTRKKFLCVTTLAFVITLIPSFNAVYKGQEEYSALWNQQRESVSSVLSIMDSHGLKRIAQYPSIYFPEAPSWRMFKNVDHFLPYLMDKAAGRKWSFGSMAHQNLWKQLAVLWNQPTETWLNGLELIGYDAVLIEKGGMSPADSKRFEDLRSKKFSGAILYEDNIRILLQIPKHAF